MDRRFPKWAQPVFGDQQACSICSSKEVYFSSLEKWEEKCDIPGGPVIVIDNFALKCWCKDCYEDCGGPKIEDI